MMSWIAFVPLMTLILLFVLAPTFEVKLDKRTTKAALGAGFLLAMAIVFQNAAAYIREETGRTAIGVFGGVALGLGLFFLLFAAARYGESVADKEP